MGGDDTSSSIRDCWCISKYLPGIKRFYTPFLAIHPTWECQLYELSRRSRFRPRFHHLHTRPSRSYFIKTFDIFKNKTLPEKEFLSFPSWQLYVCVWVRARVLMQTLHWGYWRVCHSFSIFAPFLGGGHISVWCVDVYLKEKMNVEIILL